MTTPTIACAPASALDDALNVIQQKAAQSLEASPHFEKSTFFPPVEHSTRVKFFLFCGGTASVKTVF
jgi:hypothetical protein